MTVGTDYLTFANGGGANIQGQAEYNAEPQRATGALPGLARSNFHNKATRQGCFVAHSLCLWISQQIDEYIADDGNDIAWIANYSEALTAFILPLLPDTGGGGGAFLPIAGGTMLGNIQFNSGISTILANNTWYFGKDSVGTARGLIQKGSDNNIYINDGTAPYVRIAGTPAINNNLYYGGRDTGGTVRNLIGLAVDNHVHLGGGAGNVFIDCVAGGSTVVSGNVVLPNAGYIFGKNADASARAVMGINGANQLLIGSGVTGTTDLYSGSMIYLHGPATALFTMTVNNLSYLNGGARVYIPGGNDPLAIVADNGFYARAVYAITGIAQWQVGLHPNGYFSFYDYGASAMRFEISNAGVGHFYNSLWIEGAGGCNVAGPIYGQNLTIYQAATVNNGMTVAGGLTVSSGNLTTNGMHLAYGGISASNSIYVLGGFTCDGAGYFRDALQVGGTSQLTAVAGNWLTTIGNFQAGTINVDVQYQINHLPVIHRGVSDAFTIMKPNGSPALTLYSTGQNYSSNSYHIFTPSGGTAEATWVQFNGGQTLNVEGIWRTFSGRELKRDIEPYERGLAALRQLQPVSFRYRDDTPLGAVGHETRYGMIAEDVEGIIPEMVGRTLLHGAGPEIPNMAPGHLVFLLTNAIKELAARLEALEGRV